jgi:hypothetical protein
MMKRLVVAVLAATFGLSACSGGGSSGGGQSGGSQPQGSAVKGALQLIFTGAASSPSARTTTHARKPAFLSPSAVSVVIGVSGEPNVTADVSATSPNCTTSGATRTCSIGVQAPVGTDTFTLSLYDGASGGGNLLGSGTATQAVTAAGFNVTVTVNGVETSLTISAAQTAFQSGVAATTTLTYSALDADGNTIIGTYASPVTFTSSDPAFTVSPSSVTGSGQTVTVAYSGANTTGTTISASAPNVPTASVKPQLLTVTPSVGVSGAQAACVVTLGSSTYAFVPGLDSTTDLVGLAEVKIATGSTIQSRIRSSAHAAGRPRPNVQIRRDARPTQAQLRRPMAGAGGSTILAISPQPQECAADTKNDDLYIINFNSAVVNVVHLDPTTLAMSLLATYTTDATGSISFSGGSATIIGIAFDPTDNGLIVATPTGYELYSGARATTPNTKVRNIATVSPAENFGYNSLTNQIWSPTYLGGVLESRLVDVPSGNSWTQDPEPVGIDLPDQGAVDSSTNIAVSTEEFELEMYLAGLGQSTINSPGSGEFSDPNAASVALTSTIQNVTGDCCPISDISIDPASHLSFTAGEFGYAIGVQQLPSSGSGTLGISSYVFAPLPPVSDTQYYVPGDPHAVSTFTLTSSGPFGLLFDGNYEEVFVIDMKKFLAAPRSTSDSSLVSSSYDLIANGVVYPIQI